MNPCSSSHVTCPLPLTHDPPYLPMVPCPWPFVPCHSIPFPFYEMLDTISSFHQYLNPFHAHLSLPYTSPLSHSPPTPILTPHMYPLSLFTCLMPLPHLLILILSCIPCTFFIVTSTSPYFPKPSMHPSSFVPVSTPPAPFPLLFHDLALPLYVPLAPCS